MQPTRTVTQPLCINDAGCSFSTIFIINLLPNSREHNFVTAACIELAKFMHCPYKYCNNKAVDNKKYLLFYI